MPLMMCPGRRHPPSEALAAVSKPRCLSPLPPWPHHTSSNNGNLLQVFFSLLTRRDKQAIDESGVMHRLTGTDSTRPTVNMCRQDRISALAARRCIYLPLTQTHNSTELQLPRLRSADNTCKRHHSRPLPAHIYNLPFTLSVWTALHWSVFVISTAEWLSSEWYTRLRVCMRPHVCLSSCTYTCQTSQPMHAEIQTTYGLLPSVCDFVWSSFSQSGIKASCFSCTARVT